MRGQAGEPRAHGFWVPGDFKSEASHHSFTRIHGKRTCAPCAALRAAQHLPPAVSVADALLVWAHFYTDQGPTQFSSGHRGQRGFPRPAAGAGPIQGPGLPRSPQACFSGRTCSLLLGPACLGSLPPGPDSTSRHAFMWSLVESVRLGAQPRFQERNLLGLRPSGA